jgi:septal ring factor EnvC (AmiA/AmiB activator)
LETGDIYAVCLSVQVAVEATNSELNQALTARTRELTSLQSHQAVCLQQLDKKREQIATLDAELKDTKSQLEVINVVLAVCLKVLNEPLGAGDESNSTESFNR